MSTKNPELPVIKTKLYPPSLTSDHESRSRLIEIMDRALEMPLFVVAAPTGYGKSVLASEWIQNIQLASVWLSLDTDDGDLHQFLSYLVAAIASTDRGACKATAELLTAPEPPPVLAAVSYFLNDLDDIDEPLVIVLDDYQNLKRTSVVHELIEGVLAHPPPDIHFVVISRKDPPFSMYRLRATNRVAEIRLQELQFTDLETAALVSNIVGLDISPESLENLQLESEGWAAALRLTLLAVRYAPDPDSMLKSLHGGAPQTKEYLLAEVLEALSIEFRIQLLKSSILDRFFPHLIGTICYQSPAPGANDSNGQEFVNQLQRENLFIVSLDAEGRWFRFHHLFQEMLQQQLQQQVDANEVKGLHIAASEWFAANGEITDAIRHMVSAGQIERAADIVSAHRKDYFRNDKWYVVNRWLNNLPEESLQLRPDMLLVRAWIAYHQLEHQFVAALIEQIHQIGAGGSISPAMQGELDYLQGWLAFWVGDMGKSRKLLRQSMTVIPKDSGLIAGEIRMYLAMAMQMAGEFPESLKFLESESADTTCAENDTYQSRIQAGENFVHLLEGNLGEASKVAVRITDNAHKSENAHLQVWGHYLQAVSCFHSFDLEPASLHFGLACKRKNLIEIKTAVDSLTGLALTYHWMGRTLDAQQTCIELTDFTDEFPDSEYALVADSCHARLSLLLGDFDMTRSWASTFNIQPDTPGALFFLEEPALTLARVFTAIGNSKELTQTLETLRSMHRQLDDLHLTYQIIDVLVLQALVLKKLERTSECRDVLARALKTAVSGGWLRPFIEPGPEIINMLLQLNPNGEELELVKRIEMAASTVDSPSAPPTQESKITDSQDGDTAISTDQLTNRELDILEMLGQRLHNKEIAAKLFISTHTVNGHLKNIYKKLDATNRRQAVKNAIAKNILPDA